MRAEMQVDPEQRIRYDPEAAVPEIEQLLVPVVVCRKPVASIMLPFGVYIATIFAFRPPASSRLAKRVEATLSENVVRALQEVSLEEMARILRRIRKQEHEIRKRVGRSHDWKGATFL